MLRIRFEGIGFGKLFFRPAWNMLGSLSSARYVFSLNLLFGVITDLHVGHTSVCDTPTMPKHCIG